MPKMRSPSTASGAFIKNSSTTTTSIRTVDSRKLAIDKEERVILPFLELPIAFDVIDHSTLLDKLQACIVSGKALARMRNYLSDRTQFVFVLWL